MLLTLRPFSLLQCQTSSVWLGQSFPISSKTSDLKLAHSAKNGKSSQCLLYKHPGWPSPRLDICLSFHNTHLEWGTRSLNYCHHYLDIHRKAMGDRPARHIGGSRANAALKKIMFTAYLILGHSLARNNWLVGKVIQRAAEDKNPHMEQFSKGGAVLWPSSVGNLPK